MRSATTVRLTSAWPTTTRATHPATLQLNGAWSPAPAPRDPRVRRGRQVLQGLPARQGRKGPPALPELRARQDQRDLPAQPDRKGHKACLGYRIFISQLQTQTE